MKPKEVKHLCGEILIVEIGEDSHTCTRDKDHAGIWHEEKGTDAGGRKYILRWAWTT